MDWRGQLAAAVALRAPPEAHCRMHPQDVYAPTPRGESQLRSSSTTLSAAELELLVRFDGMLTLQRSGFYVQIARERHAGAPQPGRALTAVVVEDEPTLAKFTTMQLTLSGFEVRHAANRAEVVAQIRRPPVPDVILLDVMLPDADGFDILERVRQHPVLKDVPVVMLTAKATRESVIRGISLGADGYITKPCSADGLLQVLRTVLGLPQNADLKAWNQHSPR